MRFRDTITRLRAVPGTGPDGAEIPADWDSGNIAEVTYPGEMQPLTTDENLVAQQRVESTHRAFLPAGADVLPADRLRHLGVTYQVDGEPERWRMRGRDHHVEALCILIRGG